MMSKIKGGVLALSALILFGANELQAQGETRATRAELRRGPGVERIMALRDRLELTESQVAALDEIRREAVELRVSRHAEVAEMRSRLRAGQIQRSEMMAFVEELREGAPSFAAERRERVEAILSETQLQTLEQVRAERRAFARGRASARRGGPAARGGRPFGPGMRPMRGFRRGGR